MNTPTSPIAQAQYVSRLNALIELMDAWTLGRIDRITDYSVILKYAEARLGTDAKWCLDFRAVCAALNFDLK
jgi:hypothetical protein